MDLDDIERVLCEAMREDAGTRDVWLDVLVARLLSDLTGAEPRSTDGFLPIRDEELTADRYFAVGRVYMIEDQSIDLVAFDLAFPDRASIRGTVRFGARRGHDSIEKVEKRLFAFPRESITALDWTYTFERDAGAWRFVD